MKKMFMVIPVLLLTAGAVVALIVAYLEMRKEREMEAARERPVFAKSRLKPGPNGEAVLTLDEETLKRIALKVESVTPARLDRELKGYGRVLDPAPLAALAAELASARAALAASQNEFDRLKALNAQKNASDRALQAAEAAARRDQIVVESVRNRLVLAWGKALAERADLAAFVQLLTSSEGELVRIDLPAGEILDARPTGARVVPAFAGVNPIPAQFLGTAPTVDPQVQGQGFLFLVKAGASGLAPGMAVIGYLQLPGESLKGFILPDSAVVRHAGQGWVYLRTSDDTFTRRKISLDRPTENGWFVSEGITANDRIVVMGTQALLSEEQKYRIKMLE